MREANTPMNCWVILAASMISCPWGRPVYYSHCYYETPVVCLPARTVVVHSQPIAPPVVAAEVQEVVTENAVHEEAIADAAADATAAEGESVAENASAEEEELVTAEAAAFQPLYGLSLNELALDWGVAVIGPGTLYPNEYGVVSSGGGFYGGNNGSSPSGSGGPVLPDCRCTDDVIPPPPGPTPNNTNPVPEPMSIATWALALFTAFLYARRRRLQLQLVPVCCQQPATNRDPIQS